MRHTDDLNTQPHANIQNHAFVCPQQWLSLRKLSLPICPHPSAGPFLIGHREASCAFDWNDMEDVWSECCPQHHCCDVKKTTLTQTALCSNNVTPNEDNILGRKMLVNCVCWKMYWPGGHRAIFELLKSLEILFSSWRILTNLINQA